MSSWWFSPVPLGRVARLRTMIYAFILVDVLVLRPWVADNGSLPAEFYHPLFVDRVLPFPTPTPAIVGAVKYGLLICALAGVFRRSPRLLGSLTFVLYLEWMLIAFSYGKVDHDRIAFLVALAVLPTVPKAMSRDRSLSEAAGWAVRSIQVAVVLTYFLAAMAKLRFGGIDWVNGATLMRAVLRRGTFLADPLKGQPSLLQVGQYLIVMFELSAVLLMHRGRIGRIYLFSAVVFHAVTFAALGILFWPHVICLSAFVALEELRIGRRKKHSVADGRALCEGPHTPILQPATKMMLHAGELGLSQARRAPK